MILDLPVHGRERVNMSFDNVYVVGIGGKAGSGKDTFAEFIQDHVDNCYILHFADELKNKAQLFGWSPYNKNESAGAVLKRHLQNTLAFDFCAEKAFEIISNILVPEHNLDLTFLQWYGTEYMRKQVDEDYWVRCLNDYIEDVAFLVPTLILVPDVRFSNELAWCNKRGMTVYIERDLELDRPEHESESLSDECFESWVYNGGTLEDLETEAAAFLEDDLAGWDSAGRTYWMNK